MISIQNEIQKDRKKLLHLLVEVHSQHVPFNSDHSIGEDNTCKLCKVFIQLKDSDNILKRKLNLLQEDQHLIQDFNNLRRSLGRLPQEEEYRNKKEVIDRFGSWKIFLEKTQIDFK